MLTQQVITAPAITINMNIFSKHPTDDPNSAYRALTFSLYHSYPHPCSPAKLASL